MKYFTEHFTEYYTSSTSDIFITGSKISLGTFLKNKYNMLCTIDCDIHLSEELWINIIDNIDFKKFVKNIKEYETLNISLCNCNFIEIETNKEWKTLICLEFERNFTEEEYKKYPGLTGVCCRELVHDVNIIEKFEQEEKEIIIINGKRYIEI